MDQITITRADIVDKIYDRIGLSRTESSDLLESVLKHINDALCRSESVKIASFGTFVVRQKNERIGRNPKTGVEAKITSRKVVVFKASQQIKDKM
jgi:integration host factor subunit alpha